MPGEPSGGDTPRADLDSQTGPSGKATIIRNSDRSDEKSRTGQRAVYYGATCAAVIGVAGLTAANAAQALDGPEDGGATPAAPTATPNPSGGTNEKPSDDGSHREPQPGPSPSSTEPATDPTVNPTQDPSPAPTQDPSTEPTQNPTTDPSTEPTQDPSPPPTQDPAPSHEPAPDPTSDSGTGQSDQPTEAPTTDPSPAPTAQPAPEQTQDAVPPQAPTGNAGHGPAAGDPGTQGSGNQGSGNQGNQNQGNQDQVPGSQAGSGQNGSAQGSQGGTRSENGTETSSSDQTGRGGNTTEGQDGNSSQSNDSVGDVSGLSSWVSHYLNSKDSDKDSAEPVDSDTNAGVNDVGQQADGSGKQQQAGSQRNLSALRGPLPIAIFTILALGGVGTVVARASKALSHSKSGK